MEMSFWVIVILINFKEAPPTQILPWDLFSPGGKLWQAVELGRVH